MAMKPITPTEALNVRGGASSFCALEAQDNFCALEAQANFCALEAQDNFCALEADGEW